MLTRCGGAPIRATRTGREAVGGSGTRSTRSRSRRSDEPHSTSRRIREEPDLARHKVPCPLIHDRP